MSLAQLTLAPPAAASLLEVDRSEANTPLYASGTEAAAAGLAGVEAPDEAAQTVIARLVARQQRHSCLEVTPPGSRAP